MSPHLNGAGGPPGADEHLSCAAAFAKAPGNASLHDWHAVGVGASTYLSEGARNGVIPIPHDYAAISNVAGRRSRLC
jgi:hypothetical protein